MYRLSKGIKVIALLSLLGASALSAGSTQSTYAAGLPTSLQFMQVTSGLNLPLFITNAGDGSNRLFILQQTGQIRIFKNGSLLATPFLNLSGLVSNFTGANGEQGLLGLAFDPNYATNGIFYITYTTSNNDPTFIYTTTLARYHVSSGNADLADTTSGSVLLSIPKKYTNHNGGMLTFGPDGFLYMSMGDGGSGGDPDNNAQSLHTLLGKLIRLDVESTPPPGQKYVIPTTNPFFTSSDPNVRKEIWAYGLRNPWRFSFDRMTGDLYMGDVGQNIEEEVDYQPSSSAGGQNYGWRIREGNLCYNPSSNCVNPPNYAPPVTTYDHGTNDSYGCALIGGYVYRGTASPALKGVYFYGDLCSGKVLDLTKNPNNTWSNNIIAFTHFNISSFGQDEQGELYVIDYSAGNIYKLYSLVPGAATLVTPSGDIGTNYNPTYTWNQVDGATWYLLQVNGPSGNLIYQWYTSAQANCNGTTCSVTPSTTLAGGAQTWWVLTYNSAGDGVWSDGMNFSTTLPPPPGPATLVSPSGDIGTNYNPTYKWNEVSGSTWYYLWVDGLSGNVIKQWYTSAQANCNGTSCSVMPATTLGGGGFTWKVLTYNAGGDGTWSAIMNFNTTIPSVLGPATQASPTGSIGAMHNPTYMWDEVTGSTWYYLWVNGPSGNVIKQWYTSAQTNCNGTTCSVTPSTSLPAGGYTWWILDYSTRDGTWSSGLGFTVSP
jgi:glucose/arabinose dehydrogenase